MGKDSLKRTLFIASLCATAFSLPLSVWLLSVFTILSVLIRLLTWTNIRETFRLRKKSDLLIFFTAYLVYLLWMPGTSDMVFGLSELRIKLPLIVFPLILGFSEPVRKDEIKLIITAFTTGLIVSSVAGTISGAHEVFKGLADTRSFSPYISHIRLSLMLVFGIFSSGWYLFGKGEKGLWKLFFILSACWMIIFLFLLMSLTGIIIFMFIMVITAVSIVFRKASPLIKWMVPALILAFGLFIFLLIKREVRAFYTPHTISAVLPVKTQGGNPYWNDSTRNDIENGNRVWELICEPELKKEWGNRSSLPYDSLDLRGQELKATLIRYLASAGLPRDSAGLWTLKPADVKNIEHGISNILFSEWGPWKRKTYELIWQVDYYRKGGNPSGHSITQRLEYLQAGWQIFTGNPVFGTGTGDISKEYAEWYEKNNSKLSPAYRLLCHNQFLTFLVSFGITGASVICFALAFPFFSRKRYRDYLPLVFTVIIFISMLTEDTLETHTGISFFAFFYSLLIFGYDDDPKTSET